MLNFDLKRHIYTVDVPLQPGYSDSAKEENALKAKLRRMCEKKKGGKLNVPEWLHKEWLNGDHLTMAKQFESCGFDKETLTNVQ